MTVRVVACPRPFSVERIDRTAPAGATVAELLDLAGVHPAMMQLAHVHIGDIEIDRRYWHRVRPKEGQTVTIRVAPAGGGKNPLRTVLTIGVIAASAWAGGAFGTPLAIGMFGGMGPATAGQVSLASALITAGTGLAGPLAANVLEPPRARG
jgi:hypothetical protein